MSDQKRAAAPTTRAARMGSALNLLETAAPAMAPASSDALRFPSCAIRTAP